MLRISRVNSLLKKNYRLLGQILNQKLQGKGFTDLRVSFLEILIYICENEGTPIKKIGSACNLKKQTMTSHLNELEKRGYIKRVTSSTDKRESHIFLTQYGEKFKSNLISTLNDLEKTVNLLIGEIELERLEMTLENFYSKIHQNDLKGTEAAPESFLGVINEEEVRYWT
ncbi:MAG: MarR family transcriptional regulator [Bacteriovoracaceae bacterium]|jgi:DNA-binding MarR family transcriptional regulator|nr:MarR family transcriptional regulator [Bacteriovoracaceae bacterium]